MIEIKNYIGGEFRECGSGETLPNVNPATGQVFSLLPKSGPEDVNQAVDAAKKAFTFWSKTPIEERTFYLNKIADLMESSAEILAQAETQDNGKSIHLSRTVDIPRAIKNFRFFGDAATQLVNESFPDIDGHINYVVRKPIGVVGAISPWNLPLYLLTWKVAPALAAGTTIVVKPSEVTPYTAFLFSQICDQANLPPGVLNIVHGDGPSVGEPLVKHSDVKAVSFTGSTATGKRIAQETAGTFKKLSLEMGGKNPTIIFDDADLEEAVKGAVRGAFSNNGQICLCGSRIYIQKGIYEKFKKEMIKKTKEIQVGDPTDTSMSQGAVVSGAHYEKILNGIATAKNEGGTILCGGEPLKLSGPHAEGYFISPTLIEGLSNKCATNQEEIFGPVATLQPFETEDEAIELANDTEYGLAGSVWTQDLTKAHRVARSVESGLLWVNCWMVRDLRTPFGGIKASGVGKEGGRWAFDFLTEPQNICIKI